MRYFVEFAYFGKDYHGWQNQPDAITVQSVLERGFSVLLGMPIALTGAGRTDAGVHARQMFAHFDHDGGIAGDDLVYRLNGYLPHDIAVRRIFRVPDGAHARFDALERTYEYWIVRDKDPFLYALAHRERQPLDLEAMQRAAEALLQFVDFKCFSRSNTDVKTYDCMLKQVLWTQYPDRLVFTITANRFLRNMVRAVVGTLLQVGRGHWDVDHVIRIVESRDRSQAGPSVPAKGLYLTRVCYPETIVASNG